MLILVMFQTFPGYILEVNASDTIYVPGDFLTIQEAIDNATSGDTIIVSNGRYKENIIIDKELTVQGSHKSTTLIDGMQDGDTVRARGQSTGPTPREQGTRSQIMSTTNLGRQYYTSLKL